MVCRRRSRARSLELGFVLALGLSFAIAVCLRFESGLLLMSVRSDLRAYAAFGVFSAAVWAALAARLSLSTAIVDDRASRLWPLRFMLANIGTLTVVSAAAFFWRE